MEHRWSLRTRIQIPVDVNCPGVGDVAAITRDIGLGGVFLEMREPSLPRNANVDLTFYLQGDERQTHHRLRAKVVRVTDDGIGLMFRDYDVGTFRSLQEVIHYKNVAESGKESRLH